MKVDTKRTAENPRNIKIEFTTHRPLVMELLKDVLLNEGKWALKGGLKARSNRNKEIHKHEASEASSVQNNDDDAVLIMGLKKGQNQKLKKIMLQRTESSALRFLDC